MNDYTLDEAHAIIKKQRAKLQFLRRSVEQLGELADEADLENPVKAGRRLERISTLAVEMIVDVGHIEAPTPVDMNIIVPADLDDASEAGG